MKNVQRTVDQDTCTCVARTNHNYTAQRTVEMKALDDEQGTQQDAGCLAACTPELCLHFMRCILVSAMTSNTTGACESEASCRRRGLSHHIRLHQEQHQHQSLREKVRA
ncbi:unnamed protein product [Ceratitis capitata]|uniref:(Mediterranean fruit fly) hypothetical protein n=1 Tax=Ceratitis capitata TaxID=7213 RepID=A0A811UHG1_CERCA|nr:unnamed protein product [Ceratitis capitata]